MRLGGKMHHGIYASLCKQLCYQSGIANIPLDETVMRIPFKQSQVFKISGISQTIKIVNRTLRIVGDERMNEIGTDKTGSSGNKKRGGGKCHGKVLSGE